MEKPKLLLDYDEHDRVLSFFSATESKKQQHALGTVIPRDRPHLSLDLATLSEKGADEVERIIGASVLVFFDFHRDVKTGIRDYEQAGREFAQRFAAETRKGASLRDGGAQFDIAMQHVGRAMKKYSPSDIRKAETALRWASENGYEDATSYLEKEWPTIRARLERKKKP